MYVYKKMCQFYTSCVSSLSDCEPVVLLSCSCRSISPPYDNSYTFSLPRLSLYSHFLLLFLCSFAVTSRFFLLAAFSFLRTPICFYKVNTPGNTCRPFVVTAPTVLSRSAGGLRLTAAAVTKAGSFHAEEMRDDRVWHSH